MAELRPYNPTWRDRLAQALMGDGRASPERRAMVEGLTGSSGLGTKGIGIVDALMVPGAVLGAQEAAQGGDYRGAAMAIAMAPGARVAKGLPMDEASRMARAKGMGFEPTTYYHGTRANFDGFDMSKAGSATAAKDAEMAVFMSDNPAVSDGYARMAKMPDDVSAKSRAMFEERERLGASLWDTPSSERAPLFQRMAELDDNMEEITRNERLYGQQVYPLMARGNFKDVPAASYSGDAYSKAIADARAEGLDGVRFVGATDGALGEAAAKQANILAVFDPKNIRSKFAAFDPAKRNSSDLLAGFAGLFGLGSVYGATQGNE